LSRRVLIVEDEQIVAADLESKLTRMGYSVVGTAASGEEAIRLAGEEKPEIVVMDIQLQGAMKGTEAAEQIQRNLGSKILLVTAFAGVFARDPKLRQLPWKCISKPFSLVQLQSALDAMAREG
jgi:CheY-like chemotaxis protein